MTRSRLTRYGIPIAVCMILVCIYSVEFYTLSLIKNQPILFWPYFGNACIAWLPVVILYPAVVWLARRIRMTVDNWYRTVPVHCLLAATFSILRATLAFVIFSWLYPDWGFRDYLYLVAEYFVYFMLLYWAIVGIHRFLEHIREQREYELMASRLKTQLALARLDALRAQLNPHFLFNTLNTISSLVHEDADTADGMLSRLGDLLRMSLSRSEIQEVSLKEELEFIDNYLEIQKIRLQDRLRVTTEVSAEVLDALLPTLILQPVVENAIQHAISPRRDGGSLAVRASLKDGMTVVEVEDSGPGFGADRAEWGTGLRNTEERLRQHYGSNHVFEIGDGGMGGALVVIGVPHSTRRSAVGEY